MNQIEEQKGLVEYLEAALEEAKKKSSDNGYQIAEIDRELREARSEYARLLGSPTDKPSGDLSEGFSAPTVLPQPELNLTVEFEPRHKTFLNNLKSIFTNEVKVYNITARPIETDLVVESVPWYKTLGDNLKSLFSREEKTYSNITAKPIATNLLLEEEPWYRTIFSQLKYLFVKEEQPDLQITAQPVEVEEVFKDYKFRSRSLMFSLAVHLAVLAAMLFLPLLFLRDTRKIRATPTTVTLLEPSPLLLNMPPKAQQSGGGGGGGRRERIPASLGKLPRPADRQLTPPVPKVVNPEPLLPVEPTVVVPQLSQLPPVNLPDYGDPKGIPGPPSSGPGTGGGIGTGSGGGVGPGKGGGVGPGEGGGIGGGVFRVGGGVSAPSVIYRVEPTYSEEARKAKYQGVVVLSAIVRKDGSIEILKVVRGLGLGLDENAVQALKQWKFRPGMRNGVPVDVALNIEVNFSLR
jgi:periplasmic protein TonB